MPDDDADQTASLGAAPTDEQGVRATTIYMALAFAKLAGAASVDQVIGDARKIAAYITG